MVSGNCSGIGNRICSDISSKNCSGICNGNCKGDHFTYFIGIDPGLTGAVGVLNSKGNYVTTFDLTTEPRGHKSFIKTQLNPTAIHQQLKPYLNYNSYSLIEKMTSRPNQGVASQFSLGDSFGVLRSLIQSSKSSAGYVLPRVWKGFLGLGVSKADSIQLAQTLYPGAPLSRQKDHNRAEALLIAHYAYLTQQGANNAKVFT